jgi:hypothetical protein
LRITFDPVDVLEPLEPNIRMRELAVVSAGIEGGKELVS